MENFFCKLNYLDELTNNIKQKYIHEKVCVITKNQEFKNQIFLLLSKTNVLVDSIENVKNESTKVIVGFGDYNLFCDILEKMPKEKKFCYIFSDFKSFLDFKTLQCLDSNKLLDIYINPSCILSKKSEVFNSLFECVCNKLICFQDKMLKSFYLNCFSYNDVFLKTVAKLILFHSQSREINIYNYNQFILLVKNLFLSVPDGQGVCCKTKEIYSNLFNEKLDLSFCCFLISSIYKLFLNNSNFIKLNFENSFKKIEFHKKFLEPFYNENIIINSYLTFFKTNNLISILKSNFKQIVYVTEKVNKLCAIIYKNIGSGQPHINSSNFLKAFSLASDFEGVSFASLIRNMGYLNVV